jgi:hypothetical protein
MINQNYAEASAFCKQMTYNDPLREYKSLPSELVQFSVTPFGASYEEETVMRIMGNSGSAYIGVKFDGLGASKEFNYDPIRPPWFRFAGGITTFEMYSVARSGDIWEPNAPTSRDGIDTTVMCVIFNGKTGKLQDQPCGNGSAFVCKRPIPQECDPEYQTTTTRTTETVTTETETSRTDTTTGTSVTDTTGTTVTGTTGTDTTAGIPGAG